jgi:uncharacterized membrane protein YhfC
MAAYVKYTAAVEALQEAGNAGTDTWAIALASAVNIADTTFVAGTTDLATGNGYTQGGNTVAVSSATQTAGVFKLVLASPAAWTATGAGFSVRYAILVNVTLGIPVAYWDYGSLQAVADTQQFTVTLDASGGVYTVT